MIKDYVIYKDTKYEAKLGVEIESSHWKKLMTEVLDSNTEAIESTNDWEPAVESGKGWTKYGRQMYSKKLDKLRHQSFEEFYNNGIVD